MVRGAAGILLPLIVPAIIAMIIWGLPGDPATTICPQGTCGETARQALIERYSLTSPYAFLYSWLSRAIFLDFGISPVTIAGKEVWALVATSVPNTALVMLLALGPITVGTFGAALGWFPRQLDAVFQGIGVVPAVIFALFCVAFITIFDLGGIGAFGIPMFEYDNWEVSPMKLLAGGLVLGLADGALSGAVSGTRSVFDTEFKQRYIGIAILRGERPMVNAAPNVLPTLIGQFRSRVLHLLSGTVIIEVILGIEGLGDLLWRATLDNDYFVVLGAAWGFALISSFLLIFQAISGVVVELMIRRSPSVPT
ncbi:MAG: hypothetical protein EA397_11195 [Deltaproteobacteria bacterium]|nr:MAG: hypothetical protein EA397_11195 [Deltaproteobacteria bacterium]